MMNALVFFPKCTLGLLALLSAPLFFASSEPTPEQKALAFLQREVPAWKTNNGCFSCHNNGDAARALMAAMRRGYTIPNSVLAETTEWLRTPQQWDNNQGDPGFSDKRLAKLQFSVALLAALEAGLVTDRRPLQTAAQQLLAEQAADGTWKIEGGNALGSPATWGTPLATLMALRVLEQAALPATKTARQNAVRALRQMKPLNVPTAATLCWALAEERDKREIYWSYLQRAQTREGGWGPYPDAPPECFDTALVLLALVPQRTQPGVSQAVQRGRAFLIAQQTADGSWPATTRPSGNESYAQMMSTTGWVTLALLETKP